MDQQHEAQPRCPGRSQDMARRRLKSTAHRVRSIRFQLRENSASSKRQAVDIDKSWRCMFAVRAVVNVHARTVQLPVFSTFEAVVAFVHRAGFNAVVVVIYRPGSRSVTQSFFDDFSALGSWSGARVRQDFAAMIMADLWKACDLQTGICL